MICLVLILCLFLAGCGGTATKKAANEEVRHLLRKAI